MHEVQHELDRELQRAKLQGIFHLHHSSSMQSNKRTKSEAHMQAHVTAGAAVAGVKHNAMT